MREENKPVISKDFLGFLTLFAVGLEMLLLSWQKWGDVLVDFGRELYVPWRLNNGGILYGDIAFYYGPFPPYLNAFLFKAFGTNVLIIAGFNIVLISVLAWLIYRFFFISAGRLTSFLIALTFLTVFAFSQYIGIANYNFVCPYSYGLTYGIFLSFLSLFLFKRYLLKRKDGMLFIIGVLNGLVFLSKSEVFFAIFAAALSGIFFVMLGYGGNKRKALTIGGLFLAGFAAPILVFTVYFSFHMPFQKALASIIFPYTAPLSASQAKSIFFRTIMGTDFPLRNTVKLLFAAGVYGGMILLFAFLGYAKKSIRGSRLRVIFNCALLCVIFLLLYPLSNFEAWAEALRPLPLVICIRGVSLGITLSHSRRDDRKTARILPLFMMHIFAFLLLFKMILNVHLYHYGFALAMPAALLLILFFMREVPLFLKKMSLDYSFIRMLCLALVGAALVAHVTRSNQLYHLKTYAVGTGLDTILDYGPKTMARGECFRLALNKIEELIGKDQGFLVLPQGIMLNYLTRRPNPTPYTSIMPTDLDIFGEQNIINSFEKNSPPYIVIVDVDLTEYGYIRFGKDFATGIFSWVKNNYTPVFFIKEGPASTDPFIIIAGRIKEPPR